MSTSFGKGIMYSKDVYSRIAADACIRTSREIPASRTTVRVLCLSVDKSQSSDEDGHEGERRKDEGGASQGDGTIDGDGQVGREGDGHSGESETRSQGERHRE